MKAFLFQLLVGRKLIGQSIRYVGAFIASALITWLASAPGWAQGLLNYLAENAGVALNEAGLTAFLTLIIAEVVQYALDRTNAKGVAKIQAAVDEIEDSYAGEVTVAAVENLKARLTSALDEVAELRAAVTPDKGQ